MRKTMIALAAVLVCAAATAPATAAVPAKTLTHTQACTPSSAIDRMIGYIRTLQQPDGSFPSIGQSSTADAVYALVASGVNPSQVTNSGKSAIDWIYSQTGSLGDTGVAAKFLLALTLAHRSTVAPNGFDFAAHIQQAYDPVTGLYDPNPTGDAYALIALRAAGRSVPARAVTAWAAQQQADGGWSGYLPPTNSDTNTTAVGLIALIANFRFAPISSALGYLRTQQSTDGGFAYSTVYDTASDANSTGLVILALLGAGQNLADWQRGGIDPVARLLQFQDPSGAFRYSDEYPGDSAFATFQAGQAAGVTRCRS